MTAFHTIAIPHDDILAGRLTMDVFAADLGGVFKGRALDEYCDARLFFQKTFQTEGLTNLLEVVRARLEGRGGDPVIQIQTPFGGGKTHALIAMYHKAAEWGARPVVIVGTPMAAGDTLWGMLEEQLTGQKRRFTGQVSPGRDALQDLLLQHQPVLILVDELLEYVTKAAGVQVAESTLAAQTIAFVQELTEVAGTVPGICLVLTLPSSVLEHYDERAERFFQQLQRVSGRVERIYTPVQEHEITQVVRCRLFSSLDERKMDQIINSFMTYASREGLLPAGIEESQYRQRFAVSYPFLPEVIDVLYHRWGSFGSFQRTRGVLRLLASVVHSLKDSAQPYITLADFNLGDQQIRLELLKHIGQEYDSVIASDITGADAGARKINDGLGKAYQGLNLGTRVATTVFMHSFSGGVEQRGATLGEIKRHAAILGQPASVVVEAVEQLQGKLFYVHRPDTLYFFTTQANLTRLVLNRMENIELRQIREQERNLLGQSLSSNARLKVYIWPENTTDIPDTPDLKLIILQQDSERMREIYEYKGNMPRVNRNTLFFLMPFAAERAPFEQMVRKYLAYKSLDGDKGVKLTLEQEKEVQESLKECQKDLDEAIRRLYRLLYVVGRDGFKEYDLGVPTYGESRPLDETIYDKLRSEGEILEKIVPLVIRDRFLQGRDYVLTEQLYKASLTTPGEVRVLSKAAWEQGIAEGVHDGLFGLGELIDGQPFCRYFGQQASIALSGNEVIIRAEVCQMQLAATSVPAGDSGDTTTEVDHQNETDISSESSSVNSASDAGGKAGPTRSSLRLRFPVPKGKVSSLMGMMHFLQERFSRMEITLRVEQGSLSEQEYEDKVKETFRQMGVEAEEE